MTQTTPQPPTPTLLLHTEMSQPETRDFLGGVASVFSTVSPVKTGRNEDCAALLPVSENEGVLLVADGVGGIPGGGDASRTAVESVAAQVGSTGATLPLREALLRGFEDANERVAREGGGAATTIAAAQIQDTTLRTFHCGDSEILVTDADGDLIWKTLPHSPVGYAVEAGVLTPHDALFNDARHLVSNVVGAVPTSIEISTRFRMPAGSTLLLASDGLVDNLHVEEIVERMAGPDLHRCMERLVETARQRMTSQESGPSKPDDLTILLYRATAC